MNTLENVIRTYGQALKDNDYQTVIGLFSKEAKIFYPLADSQSPADFFQKLFANSQRDKVEIRNVFFDLSNKNMVAAYIYLEGRRGKKQSPLQTEAVDIFEFDQENKIANLKIIYDTYLRRNMTDD